MHKITHGYVKQTFDENGCCLSQEFVAGDEVEWEDLPGPTTSVLKYHTDPLYHPFDMVQPEKIKEEE